jgi:hypothetical protein
LSSLAIISKIFQEKSQLKQSLKVGAKPSAQKKRADMRQW